MRISEVIKKMQDHLDANGDVEVICHRVGDEDDNDLYFCQDVELVNRWGYNYVVVR